MVYNNASADRTLEIPIDDTPIASATDLHAVFGNISAEIRSAKVRVTLPGQSLAVFRVK